MHPSSVPVRVTLAWAVAALIAVGLYGCESSTAPPEDRNRAPTVTIASPDPGATYSEDQSVQLSGSASDPEDGSLSGGALEWFSSIDGRLGAGQSLVTGALSPGDHSIELVATDSDGAQGSSSVGITVEAVEESPSATISEPADGSTFAEGESVTFEGSASDPEDGDLTGGALVWESSRDGDLGSGTTVTRSDLSLGTHTIRLIATDSDANADTASIAVTVEEVEESPSASIQAPADGATFAEGESVTFEGSADDPQDGTLTGSALAWESSLDGALGTGTSVSTSDLSVGTHTIRLIAADSDANADTASIDVTVNEGSPTASIESPADRSTFTEGEAVTFEGSGSDPQDGALTGSALAWESSRDGDLGTGESVTTSTLSTGDHTVRLVATDSDGNADTASILVEIGEPQVPAATITSPADGSTFDEGESVTFEGSADDPQDGALTGSSLAWESSLDGSLGTGTSVTTSSLSVGTHTVTLTATDNDGNTDQAAVTVEVLSNQPTATIAAPADGSTFDEGESVTFEGSADDPQDGALTGSSLAWESSLDGSLGNGASVSTSGLSVGTHTIRLIATDADGNADTASISVEILTNQPTATITSPADGATFAEGASVTLEGSGSDPQDGTLTGGSLAWESSLDGSLGSGASVSTATLSVGNHTIRLIATDSDANADTASIDVTVEEGTPSASITSPSDGAAFGEGESITFEGTGSDPQDGTLAGSALRWKSSADGDLGTGTTVTTSSLSLGTHTIRLIATDSHGNADTASITIEVNLNQPTATITSPADGSTFDEGESITFEGSGDDPQDGTLTGSALAWESSVDGGFGTGTSVTTSSLSVGSHTIRLIATDSDGNADTASIALEVLSNQPTATITAPSDGASFLVGASVTFEGSGSDPQDGTLTGSSLGWESSLDGSLGTGTSVTSSSLSVGTHTIRLVATDSDANSDTASITVSISESQPTASITSPSDGASFAEGASVTFEGSGSDPQDGTLTGASLAWESSLDGSLGTGTSVTTSSLSVGSHTIRLIATDSDGNADTASIALAIDEGTPTATITSPSDGATFADDESVTFEGSGSDPQDGTLTGGSLAWESSLDGDLGTGATVSVSSLTAGSHTIRLVATDSHDNADTAAIAIEVKETAASLTVSPHYEVLGASGSTTLSITAEDATGSVISDPALITASRNTSVATVSDATVTAQGTGVTDVIATSGSASDSARVAVVASGGFAGILSSGASEFVISATAGETVTLSLIFTPPPGGSGDLASVAGDLSWDASQLSYQSSAASASGWSWTPNESSVASGTLAFNAFNTTGETTEFTLATITFDVVGGSGTGPHALDLTITTAGDETGANITADMQSVDSAVEIQ